MGIGDGGRWRWGGVFFSRRKAKVGGKRIWTKPKKGGGAGANTRIPGLTKSRKLDNLGSGVGHMQCVYVCGGEVVEKVSVCVYLVMSITAVLRRSDNLCARGGEDEEVEDMRRQE